MEKWSLSNLDELKLNPICRQQCEHKAKRYSTAICLDNLGQKLIIYPLSNAFSISSEYLLVVVVLS
jgi:hypothetical protein